MGVLHTGTIWVSGLLKEENKIPQIKNMARATLPHFKNMRSATPQPRNLIDACSLYTLTQLNICTNCIVMKITFARDCICEAPMPTYKQEVSSWATHLARTHPVLASPQLVHFNILIPADNRLPGLRSLELLFSQHATYTSPMNDLNSGSSLAPPLSLMFIVLIILADLVLPEATTVA